jgi:hypothetical protein
MRREARSGRVLVCTARAIAAKSASLFSRSRRQKTEQRDTQFPIVARPTKEPAEILE